MENQLNFAAISDEELAEINGGGINIWEQLGV
ncbi:lactococcin family bacteriocin [Lactococcus cremoris]|nr:lactococcin family bacteriocin [Lactococcus cremoris]